MRVRESNNVLQAVQMNQTFIKLGNKRNVLGWLTEIKLRETSSNIVRYGGQTSNKTMLDDVLRRCFTRLDRPLRGIE